MGFLNISSNYAYNIGMVGIFIGVCLLFSGLYHMVIGPMVRKRQLESRLKNTGRERLAKIQILKTMAKDEKGVVLAVMEKIAGWGKIDNLQRVLLQADIFWRPTTFISVIGILFCAGFILIWLWQKGLFLGIGIGAALGFIPIFILRLKRGRKSRLFEMQMPECMELLARSMRAGHALPSAIELASKEIAAPLGVEMKIVYEEQRLGLGLLQALRRLGERVNSQDLQYFITAVLLQVETGGNLAEILENIGFLIRERLKLKGKIQALTAEGRFSALILTLLPFVVFVAITILNPKYMNALVNEPVGMKLITGGLISMGFGVLWMRKIIQIRV
jgi:tight adherence protein B